MNDCVRTRGLSSSAPGFSAAGSYGPSTPMSMPVQYASYLLAASPPTQLLQPVNSPQILGYLNSSPLLLPDFYQNKLQSSAHQAVADTINFSRKLKLKKQVRFADSVGLSLTSIHEFGEAREEPPRVCTGVLGVRQTPRSKNCPQSDSGPRLRRGFQQPAADYVAFRQSLETDCVCLENVVIKDKFVVTGTIKVKNLDYCKTVFVRCTTNNWRTHKDYEATFLPNPHSSNCEYDTFSFDLGKPLDGLAGELQFSVCFICQGREYWDNNKGMNYSIQDVSESTNSEQNKPCSVLELTHDPSVWSSFASWSDLITCGPYW